MLFILSVRNQLNYEIQTAKSYNNDYSRTKLKSLAGLTLLESINHTLLLVPPRGEIDCNHRLHIKYKILKSLLI